MTAPASIDARVARESACAHCGALLTSPALDADLAPDGDALFCCRGCRLVYTLLRGEGLERYYALRGPTGIPGNDIAVTADALWLEPVVLRLRAGAGVQRVDVDLQGVHCAACVWLLETLFRRRRSAGAHAIRIDPGVGRAHLFVSPSFDLASFAQEVARFGYRMGPATKTGGSESGAMLVRMGVCVAIAMNAMLLAIAVYAGLPDGPLHRLFDRLSLALATAAVLVGGTGFFISAWRSLRRGILHLDLPIAVGIALAYTSSLVAFVLQRRDASYFDTLCVFIALMLVGRWLQAHLLEQNRRWLLASDGVEGLKTRRFRSDASASTGVVACTSIVAGDRLSIAVGELIAVACVLEGDAPATVSLDWIDGESAPRLVHPGDALPAGAFSASRHPLIVRATAPFSASILVELLRAPVQRDADALRPTSRFWTLFSSYYVVGVFVLAALGFGVGWLRTHDALRALDVVTAVLIVTCPCAFGIAVPLAYENAIARLRRAGLFVRSPGFLDRARTVKRVVFDKTGTLTTGTLSLESAAPLFALDRTQRAIVRALSASSAHPKSVAVTRALERDEPSATASDPGLHALRPRDVPGCGTEATSGGHVHRLGAPAWAVSNDDGALENEPDRRADVAYSIDGVARALLTTRETLRSDARAEVARLRASGLDVHVLSGDAQARVQAIALACGVDADHAHAAHSPHEKAAWLRAHDHRDTLMIGDGLNDSLVVGAAWCSGTPAIDRPFMAARADFYFVTPGLAPIRLALEESRALAATVRRVLVTAVAYNVLTLSLAYAGVMSPLACAVLMPLSSLSSILSVVRGRVRSATAPSNIPQPTVARV